jgi:surface antigen
MRKNILTTFGFAMALLAGHPSQAANMAFMADQAMSRFTDQDAELFNQAAGKALMGKEGAEIKWSNPATGAFGTLTPYPDPEKNADCRVIHMVNIAENVKSAGYYRFCKGADGTWPPVMPPRKSPNK